LKQKIIKSTKKVNKYFKEKEDINKEKEQQRKKIKVLCLIVIFILCLKEHLFD
jgi:hypothetical protein